MPGLFCRDQLTEVKPLFLVGFNLILFAARCRAANFLAPDQRPFGQGAPGDI
jgi:hypothetical protein